MSNVHRWERAPVEVARKISGGREPESGVAEVILRTPEARVRTRGTLLYVPNSPLHYSDLWGGAYDFGIDCKIWVYRRDWPASLTGGQPVENLIGNFTAPQVFPAPGCMGYGFEVETDSCEIGVYLNIGTGGYPAGRWMFSARWDAVQVMTEAEWARVEAQASIQVLRSCIVGEGG